MKKLFYSLTIFFSLLLCTQAQAQPKTAKKVGKEIVNVYYFHSKFRCPTCRAIEAQTRELLSKLKDQNLVMHAVDISESEGKVLAEKYQVTGSSLILDKGGKTTDLTEAGFMYAKNNPTVFKQKLEEAIRQLKQ